MKTLLAVALVLVLIIAVSAVFFRMTPMPAEVWHVDPAEVSPPSTPNFVLLRGDEAPRIDASPSEVAQRLARVAADEGATRIAGDLDAGHATYVVRTPLMGFPDAVSIRLMPEGAQTRVEIFSRSRFGQSDLGANRARVDRWLAALAS